MMDDFNNFNVLKAHSITGEEAGSQSFTDRQDETNIKLDDVKNDIQSVREGIDSIKESLDEALDADVVKEKQQINNSTIETSGSIMGNQNIIQTAYIYGGNAFDIKEVTNKSIINENSEIKEYDLTKVEEFAAFGEKFKAGEHFAFAVMVCVFEYIELDDLQNLKSRLMDELPKVIDEEGKEAAVYQNPYFPVSSALKAVKGKEFTTAAGEKCVGLGEARPLALKNLWEQFPLMRDCISRWLLKVSDIFEYRTNFDTYQVTMAFVNIMKLDYSAGVRHIFPRLYSNSDKAWLLGAIAFVLYNSRIYREKVLPLITEWASSDSFWLWRSAFYVYSYISNDDRNGKFDAKVQKMLESRLESFDLTDLQYISRFLIYSESTRTLIARILVNLAVKRKTYNDKQRLAAIYLLCIRIGYYAVTDEYVACPLVACDTKNQLLDIQPLITIALQRHNTRRALFRILEAYLKEISNYSVTVRVTNHVKAYFVLMVEHNPRHRADILMMLQKCDCALAAEISGLIKKKS